MVMARPLRRLNEKPLLRTEDVTHAVEEMAAAMARVGSRFSAQTRLSGRASASLPSAPDLSALAANALREYLEDEVVELERVDGQEIPRDEVRHELMKKALVGLKMPALRAVAERRGLAEGGKGDEVAQRVAASYDWDEAAIAQLVLDHTEEPTETKNGPSTRIFLLQEVADLEQIESRLAYVAGRYIRTGIARWFVFEDYSRVDKDALCLRGSLRTYRPHVEGDAEGASLHARSVISPVQLLVTRGSRYVKVEDASSVTASKAMIAAFEIATALETMRYLPGAEAGAEEKRNSLHPVTLFLLDLVTGRLRGSYFRHRNPVLARFRLSKSNILQGEGASAEQDPPRRPRLSAVRFEGEYLLDSPAACRLMLADGRPLVDLTLRVAVSHSHGGHVRAWLPVRLAVGSDHVMVATGLSAGDARLTLDVHAAAVDAVVDQLESGVTFERAEALTKIVREQLETTETSVEVRLLDDEIEKI